MNKESIINKIKALLRKTEENGATKEEANKRFNLKDIDIKDRVYDDAEAYSEGIKAGKEVQLRRVINGQNTDYLN